MNSKARIGGRPIHPMLVGFPIVLFTVTLGLELAYLQSHDTFYFRAAMVANVVGVLLALVAALPGAIDLISLPRSSGARATGIAHALFNFITLIAFGVSAALLSLGWKNRMMVDGVYELDAHLPLAVGLVGFVAMVTAGTLGWSLVQTHHVGIDPREPDLTVDEFHDSRSGAIPWLS